MEHDEIVILMDNDDNNVNEYILLYPHQEATASEAVELYLGRNEKENTPCDLQLWLSYNKCSHWAAALIETLVLKFVCYST